MYIYIYVPVYAVCMYMLVLWMIGVIEHKPPPPLLTTLLQSLDLLTAV